MKRRSTVYALICIGLLTDIVGCGSALAPRTVTTTETPTVISKPSYPPIVTESFDDPTSDHEIIYSVDLVSRPLPDPPPKVNIDAAAARDAAAKNSPSPDLEPGEPSTTLRIVKVGLPENNPEFLPAWILIFANSHPIDLTPADVPASKAAPMTSDADCEMVVVVDASSGQTHGATQYCR